MKPFRNHVRVSRWYALAIAFVIVAGGCAIYTLATPTPAPKASAPNAVRGYLAAAIGRSADPELGGFNSAAIDGKDVYLPGVTVFLEDALTGKRGDSARTDLSGRFTVYAPDKGRYRICWDSKVYDSGCTAVFVSAGSEPQFVSTLRIRVPAKRDYVAVFGHVTTADDSIPRTYDPLLNINAFATVGLDDDKGKRIADVYVNNFGDYLFRMFPSNKSSA